MNSWLNLESYQNLHASHRNSELYFRTRLAVSKNLRSVFLRRSVRPSRGLCGQSPNSRATDREAAKCQVRRKPARRLCSKLTSKLCSTVGQCWKRAHDDASEKSE